MDEEINKLINFISNSEKNSEYKQIFKPNKKEIYSTRLMFIAGIISLAVSITDIDELLTLICLLIFLLTAVIFISISAISIRRSLLMPLDEYFENFSSRLRIQEQYVLKLSEFSLEAITSLNDGMQADIKKLQSRVSFLVGGIKKVGLFPALIAIFIASFQLIEKTSFNYSNIIVAVIVGMYLGAFLLLRLSNTLEEQIMLLNKAIEYKKENNS